MVPGGTRFHARLRLPLSLRLASMLDYDAAMHEGSYFTYIMASRSHTLYIGITGDLHKRVFQHKWKEQEGFTARYNCDRLVWYESHGRGHKGDCPREGAKGLEEGTEDRSD